MFEMMGLTCMICLSVLSSKCPGIVLEHTFATKITMFSLMAGRYTTEAAFCLYPFRFLLPMQILGDYINDLLNFVRAGCRAQRH